jgi:hypothetical protein
MNLVITLTEGLMLLGFIAAISLVFLTMPEAAANIG